MAWGDRCEDGNLYGCRNLDWAKDTGISANKCVTVFHPIKESGELGIASVIFGYIGVLGAMAGINEEGIALSEIGAFNARETYDGRPWHYVFREVLEGAKNIDEAVDIFKNGNFVQGYCFNAGWGDPRRKGTPGYAPQGISIEVDAENTEILYDNDPQELNAVCVDTSGETILFDGKPVYYGLPLKNATFRADTAFSKSVRRGQYADKGPAGAKNSGNAQEGRTWKDLYQPISQMIKTVTEGGTFDLAGKEDWHFSEANPHPMTRDEALNICKMAGDNSGNVMSIFYDATNLQVGVAFETGTGESWTPAAIAGYVDLDLAKAFKI
ncbi:MAG: carcinine hydrolase/isopenicillin-N N-acyltransferase family protein [Eubacteriales bacterium]